MVQAMLASTLYKALKCSRSHEKTPRVSTGFQPLDEALHGGIKAGAITAISGERGTGKTLIALHTLVTHLLSNPTSQAAIIDTTGSLDVLRLHGIIITRIKTRQNAARAAATGNADPTIFYDETTTEELNGMAARVLDRVKIMRVFDFVGMSEAIGELHDSVQRAEGHEKMAAEPTQQKQRRVVADSQAEEGDEDVMLLDGAANEKPVEGGKLDPVSLVVIDNITSVVNPILKTSYVQGQTILTSFMRSLARLSSDHNMTNVLINTAASPARSYPNLTQLNRRPNAPPSTFVTDPQAPITATFADQPSIFASTTVHPSLRKTFAGLVDVHLLISMLPKRKQDARVLIGGEKGKADTVFVAEVLSDRYGASQQRWAAFEVGEDGTTIKSPV